MQVGEVFEVFFSKRVERAEMDPSAFKRRHPAGGENVDRKVQRQRAGVEKVQRPKVNRAAGQIGTARRMRNDGGSGRSGNWFPQNAELYDIVVIAREHGKDPLIW